MSNELLVDIPTAFSALRDGRALVVVDDDGPGAHAAVMLAAERVTAEQLVWLGRCSAGQLSVALSDDRGAKLALTPMVNEVESSSRSGVTVSVDVITGNSSGTSPADQARTIRALADQESRSEDFVRPGHVFPLRVRPGGVLKRAGHVEAAVDLCVLAELEPVAVVAGLVSDDGELMLASDAVSWAAEQGLAVVSIADLIRHRRQSEQLVEHFAAARLPTDFGEFTAHAYRSLVDGVEHVAYVMGDVNGGEPPLVRVHSECLTGDILASNRCDCGPQLRLALQMIADEGRGVLVYLRGHEGRGIGIGHKMRAYALQDEGLDTVDANAAQGLPVDSREYGVGANMLADLGVTQMRILTNNPAKLTGLSGFGLEIVDRVAVEIPSNPENLRYLETKRTRMGHTLSSAPAEDAG